MRPRKGLILFVQLHLPNRIGRDHTIHESVRKMSDVTTKSLWENSKTEVTGAGHPADAGYAPPVASVKLPSRGLVYPPESPLHRLESVDIKPVSAREENILASEVLIRKGTVLTTLMRACITNRTIDPDEMLVGDRNAILTAIRISAYGPKYHAGITCDKCGTDTDHEFDLSRLTLHTLDIEPIAGPGTNEFSHKLPVSGREVRFKLMTSQDTDRLDKDMAELKKKTGQEQAVTMRLAAQVTFMQGVKQEHLVKALADIPARDSRALRGYMDNVAPGVDMTQDFECPSCGKKGEVDVPIGTEFFWPSAE